jgi:hypothetical protein
MQTSRRASFNPTSIPRLRTPSAPRRDFYNAGRIPRNGWKGDCGRGIRRESTETGENRTGHITFVALNIIPERGPNTDLQILATVPLRTKAFYSSTVSAFQLHHSHKLIPLDIFPLKLTWALRLPWQAERNLPDLLRRFNSQTLSSFEPLNLVKRAIPQSVPMKVTEILPRLKDG